MIVEYKNRFFNPDAVAALIPNAQVWTTLVDNSIMHRLIITVTFVSLAHSVSIYTDQFITQDEYKKNVFNNARSGQEWLRKKIQDELVSLMNFINKNKGKN